MGVILPKRQQEGYHVSQILAAAPWGLVLMLAMVLVTFLILGRKAHWIPLLLLAVAYDLYYLFMAYLADCWPGLPGGMIISGLVLTVLVTPLFFAWTEKRPAAATVKFFILFIAVYPLIRISEHEGLFLSMLYVGLLAYTVILLVLRRRATAGE